MENGLREIVARHLSAPSKCYRHCDAASRHYFAREADIGYFACEGGYVSRIIAYGKEEESRRLKEFISSVSAGTVPVGDGDVRVATRHPLELGLGRELDPVIRETYWVQNYRHSSSDDPAKKAIFRCTVCGKLHLQNLSTRYAVCDDCRTYAATDGIREIVVVYANWCPHCVPTTLEAMNEIASAIGAKLRMLDIDAKEHEADEFVKSHGDWSPDYIIPQVFLVYGDGRVRHILTGFSEGVDYTRRAVENIKKLLVGVRNEGNVEVSQ